MHTQTQKSNSVTSTSTLHAAGMTWHHSVGLSFWGGRTMQPLDLRAWLCSGGGMGLGATGRAAAAAGSRQGPTVGTGTAWAGGPRTTGSHPHREAPPSPSFTAGDGQRSPTCVAYQPTWTPLPVPATSKQTLIKHWDVFPTCFSISQPLQLPSARAQPPRRRRRAPGGTTASLGAEATPWKGTLSLHQRDMVTATGLQRPSSLPGPRKRQQWVEKQQSACSSVLWAATQNCQEIKPCFCGFLLWRWNLYMDHTSKSCCF